MLPPSTRNSPILSLFPLFPPLLAITFPFHLPSYLLLLLGAFRPPLLNVRFFFSGLNVKSPDYLTPPTPTPDSILDLPPSNLPYPSSCYSRFFPISFLWFCALRLMELPSVYVLS